MRPREDLTITTIGTQGRESPHPGSPASETSSLSSSQGRGPILSGPGDNGFYSGRGRFSSGGRGRGRGRGRTGRGRRHFAPTKKNAWRRESTGDGLTAAELQEKSEVDATKSSPPLPRSVPNEPTLRRGEPVKQSHHTNQAISSPELKKVGNYKLVLSQGNDHPSREIASNDIAIEATTNRESSRRERSVEGGPLELEWEGVAELTDLKRERRIMIPRGSNKLVLSKSLPSGDSVSATTTGRAHFSPANAQKFQHRKRPISSANRHGPTVKRVKIGGNIKEDGNSEEKGKDSENDALTDFAYRETASSRPRGCRFSSERGGWGGRGPRGKNMGLVRVNPDESKTPICPTFLRGVRCENERCTKRHDVPRQSAMPVCSFFTRHGQCLKGVDCPFRHVKVNPLAMLCPNFNVLGYCDDEQCIMKHVSASKTAKSSGSK